VLGLFNQILFVFVFVGFTVNFVIPLGSTVEVMEKKVAPNLFDLGKLF
jgi:hypothetical protein